MRRFLFSTLLAALAFSSAGAGIDLTPSVTEYTKEGFVYRKVTMKYDGGHILFVPPQGWTVRGASDRVQLTPPNKDFVDATILAAPLLEPQPFDEKTEKELEARVLKDIPPGAEGAQIVRREENPVFMGQNLSFGVVMTYKALGQTFQRSVIFMHAPDTQLVFRLTAKNADFAALDQNFRRSITSWQWVEAKPAQSAVSTAGAP